MAAVLVSGSQGKVTIPTAAGGGTAYLTRWSGTLEREVFDATTFGDTGNARTKIGGMMHLTGSADGFIDDVESPDLGTLDDNNGLPTAGFELVMRDGTTDNAYTFSGIISSIAVTVEKTGQTAISIAFESSGAITQADYT